MLRAFFAALALALPASAAGATPEFQASVSRIDAATRAWMTGRSWHPGCPVGFRRLRLVRVSYWRFDGTIRTGRLVVHRDQATNIVTVMRRLYAVRFPIRRMRLVDAYDGNDRRSMRADNTSAFNCRPVSGTSSWSQHAYGRAIDVNPVENPYVSGSYVSPSNGAEYADRSLQRPGMIHAGDGVVRAFRSVGWGWGGNWTSPKDYQHFSANGH